MQRGEAGAPPTTARAASGSPGPDLIVSEAFLEGFEHSAPERENIRVTGCILVDFSSYPWGARGLNTQAAGGRDEAVRVSVLLRAPHHTLGDRTFHYTMRTERTDALFHSSSDIQPKLDQSSTEVRSEIGRSSTEGQCQYRYSGSLRSKHDKGIVRRGGGWEKKSGERNARAPCFFARCQTWEEVYLSIIHSGTARQLDAIW